MSSFDVMVSEALLGISGIAIDITTVAVACISIFVLILGARLVKAVILGDSSGADDDSDFMKGQSMIDDDKERECKRRFGSDYKGYLDK